MPKDHCYRKIKAQYDVFPSARASQAIAKCRKASGNVRKTEDGTALKRWQDESWKDQKTGKDCGAGGKNEYCRPSKRVSKETPKTSGEMSSAEKKRKSLEKLRVGMGNRVSSTKRKSSRQKEKKATVLSFMDVIPKVSTLINLALEGQPHRRI
jgi:hypothetical protein